MVKAAVYAARDDEVVDEGVWEVYQVVERRVVEGADHVVVGVPDQNREDAVKDVARALVDGGMDDETLASCRRCYRALPSGGSSRVGELRDAYSNYTEGERFDPY